MLPERRRQGLATMLLREGERRLCKRGAMRLTAIVADEEAGAMAFWRAAGYERQQHQARLVRHPDTATGDATRRRLIRKSAGP